MTIDITRVPFDVWEIILALLTVYDIAYLGSTCRFFYHTVHQHSVWHSIFRDLLCAIPLQTYFQNHKLGSMSSDEIRSKATDIVRLDRAWHKGIINPSKISGYNLDKDVHTIRLLSGGDWVFIALLNGTIMLCQSTDMASPCVTRTLPNGLTEDSLDIRTSVSPNGEIDIFVLETHGPTSRSSIYGYHINMDNISIDFSWVLEVSEHVLDFCGDQDLLVLAWWETDTIILEVRKISEGPNYTHAKVKMDIGRGAADEDSNFTFSVHIITEHLVLLFCAGNIFSLYEIPWPEFLDDSPHHEIVPCSPLWTFTAPQSEVGLAQTRVSNSLPKAGPILRDGECQGRISFLTSTYLIVLILSQLPEDCAVTTYSLTSISSPESVFVGVDIGCHHAFWFKRRSSGMLVVGTCAFFMTEEQNPGIRRLEYGDVDSRSVFQVRTIPMLAKHASGFKEISWDEESGRLCLFNRQKGRVLFVDLL